MTTEANGPAPTKRFWIVGSQFGIYHVFDDCPGITFAVEVDILDSLGRSLCPACEKRRQHDD